MSLGQHTTALQIAAGAVLSLTVASTIFVLYLDTHNIHDDKPKAEPIIVAWTPFFNTDLKNYLPYSHHDCLFKCHFVNRDELKFYTRHPSAFIIHGRNMDIKDLPKTHSNQLKVLLLLESPFHARGAIHQVPRDYFNATITYRQDSHYVKPYGQFKLITPNEPRRNIISQEEIMRAIKRKKRGSLIFVSNCNTPSHRERVIKELGEYTQITVRGKCEDLLSSNNETKGSMCKSDCSDEALIQTHRFYISFENSICNDYITEKFFKRISQLMVPVVLKRSIYQNANIPSGSYIALDDFSSIAELGAYLNHLRANDTEYLKYFEWTKYYTKPIFHSDDSVCRLCEDVHNKEKLVIPDIVQYYTANQCSLNP